MPPSRIRRILRIVHRVWITAGALSLVVFTTRALLAYRASALAHTALEADPRVTVTDRDTHWKFLPGSRDPNRAGLVSFPAPRSIQPRTPCCAAASPKPATLSSS